MSGCTSSTAADTAPGLTTWGLLWATEAIQSHHLKGVAWSLASSPTPASCKYCHARTTPILSMGGTCMADCTVNAFP
eukprot:12033306-Heterocapsa_arctica.AAC.1